MAEVQRSVLKQFGINLGAAINSGNFSTSLLTENSLPLTAAAGLGTLPLPGIGTLAASSSTPACQVAGVASATTTQGLQEPRGLSAIRALPGSFHGATTAMTGALRALERDGLVRVLAEPNLTTVSGEGAKFLAGGEFPVPALRSTRPGRSASSYKPFGVGLAFTPVVLSDGRISS